MPVGIEIIDLVLLAAPIVLSAAKNNYAEYDWPKVGNRYTAQRPP